MRRSTFYLLLLLLLSACYKPIDEVEESSEPKDSGGDCALQISVFSSSVSGFYPVYILVFDTGGARISSCTLTEQQPSVSLSLSRNTYRIVALSGTSYYSLPNTLQLSSRISQLSDPLPRRPLLMGQVDVTLASASALANIQLDNMTAKVNVEVSSLSALTHSVKVRIGSLYSSLDLYGGYSDARSVTLPCTFSHGVWCSDTVCLLPAYGNNTVISMEVFRSDSTINYGYNVPFPLEREHAYSICPTTGSGVYINNVWSGQSSSQVTTHEDTICLSVLPGCPSLWDGHVVAAVDATGDNEYDLLLLSCNEWEKIHSAHSETYASEAVDIARSYQEAGSGFGRLNSWNIPTKEQAKTLKSMYAADRGLSEMNALLQASGLTALSALDAKGENIRYLCIDANNTFTFGSSGSSLTQAGAKATYRLRLVKEVHVKVAL